MKKQRCFCKAVKFPKRITMKETNNLGVIWVHTRTWCKVRDFR